MKTFGLGLSDEIFKGAKVPDFISRLKGFVDVLGPDPQEQVNDDPSTADPFFVIRRAILLRSILWRNARHLFQPKDGFQTPNIDKGVRRAFLKIRTYKHGIRSMEQIVNMSQLSGKTKFERSSLPPEAQLDIHVDGLEFLALVQQLELTDEILEKLSISFHQYYCEQQEKKLEVEPADDSGQMDVTPSAMLDFYDLPIDEQEQNRDQVRHINNKLAASGFIMIPARSNQPPFEFPFQHQVDELAKMEHERWMRKKFTDGWKSGPKTIKSEKIHADLVPWEELEKRSDTSALDKDRDFVRAIPGILAKAGYTVVALRPTKAEG
jgi:hypothetical protein